MAGPARRAGRQAQGAGLLVALALAACANVEGPPGGPPDTTPPAVVRVRPESGAVVPDLKGDAVIQFDEVIEEVAAAGTGGVGGLGRDGGPQALTGLARQVILSPVAGAVDVSWHRSAIHVKPAEGWKPGRVYRLELLPGITDLRRNRLARGRLLIFSTGPSLPHAALAGTALQWVEQRALAQALIRAVRLPDTLAYFAFADSAGEFRLLDIPAGSYVVYAVQDQNGNRQRDRREAYDSALVTLDTTASALLWAFVHDTVGPRLRSAEPIDSVTFRLVFSQPLDPGVPLDTAKVAVFALPDTTPLPVAAVWTVPQYDSVKARERTGADTATGGAAPGAAGARRAAAEGAAPPVDAPAGGPAPAAPRAPAVAGPPAAADTARIRRLLRQRPVPADRVVVRTATPLVPGAKYLVRVTGATNLNGAAADGQAVLTVPAPPKRPAAPARDTTRSP